MSLIPLHLKVVYQHSLESIPKIFKKNNLTITLICFVNLGRKKLCIFLPYLESSRLYLFSFLFVLSSSIVNHVKLLPWTAQFVGLATYFPNKLRGNALRRHFIFSLALGNLNPCYIPIMRSFGQQKYISKGLMAIWVYKLQFSKKINDD